MKNLVSAFLGTSLLSQAEAGSETTQPYDIVVYGGTTVGVVAAVQVARMGRSVLLVEPGRHLDGLSSGGFWFRIKVLRVNRQVLSCGILIAVFIILRRHGTTILKYAIVTPSYTTGE